MAGPGRPVSSTGPPPVPNPVPEALGVSLGQAQYVSPPAPDLTLGPTPVTPSEPMAMPGADPQPDCPGLYDSARA